MKHIKLFLYIIILLLFSASLNAQTDEAMKTEEAKTIKEMTTKGFEHSETLVFTTNEIAMGASLMLFPGNQYTIVLSTDGQRQTTFTVKGEPRLFDVEEKIEKIKKEFFIGEIPKSFSEKKTGSSITQEVNMQHVVIPIDYDIDMSLSEKDIQSDTKLNLMIFYKSRNYIRGFSKKNEDENYYAKYWEDYMMKKREENKNKPEVDADSFLKEMQKKAEENRAKRQKKNKD